MKRHCDTGRTDCPHIPECIWDCHYDTAGLEPVTRKVKPYPLVPEDIEPIPDAWNTVSQVMLWAVLAMFSVFILLMLFTGVFIWSLLI